MSEIVNDLFGRLVKLQQTRMIGGTEAYGELETDIGLVTFVVEPDIIKDEHFFDSVDVGEYYLITGQISEMDDDLWDTFEDDFPWSKPHDIVFVKTFESAKAAADIFVF